MKKILIFGANSAIAKQCSKIWAKRGDSIYLVARKENDLYKIKNDLSTFNSKNIFIHSADLRIIENHGLIIDKANISMGGIDIVLVAHGTLPEQKDCELSVDKTILEINNNAISSISILTLISNLFEKKQSGAIAIISSVAGDRGRASNYVYGSAKSMVTEFASGLRQRLNSKNVSVLTIKPGLVDTPMTAKFKKGILWSSPYLVAKKIIKAIDDKKDEIYVPGFWKFVMLIICLIPTRVFKRIRF